uniref:ERC protein 2-like n=1 Tax=Angiostrongylus cantonensis TaxID=6313 RepID=A0A0K0DMP6_ANGCA
MPYDLDSSDALRKTLSRREIALAEKSKEIEALKDCKSKLCDRIEQLSAEIEKLREREYHTRTILEVNKESTDVINSGSETNTDDVVRFQAYLQSEDMPDKCCVLLLRELQMLDICFIS